MDIQQRQNSLSYLTQDRQECKLANSSVNEFCSSRSGGFLVRPIPCWIDNNRIQFLIFDLTDKWHQIVCF